MSGPIVRSYGVPNWDEIFGNGNAAEEKSEGKKAAKPAKTAKAAAKKPAAKKVAAKAKKSKGK